MTTREKQMGTKRSSMSLCASILTCHPRGKNNRESPVHLLRDGRVAEGNSGARLDRVELWGVTEGGNRDNGAEGATLVLLTKEGDSGFGVEELDVAVGKRKVEMFTES